MAISITEKQHWKERIENKIDRRIRDIKLKDQNHFTQIENQAKQLISEQLGVAENLQRLKQAEEEQKRLGEEQSNLICSTYEILTSERRSHHYNIRHDVDHILAPHIQRKQRELLQSSELGREIAKLEAEKENLLDTIWLATSPRQMTEMWSKVLKLIGEEVTDFQREVLTATKPDEQ